MNSSSRSQPVSALLGADCWHPIETAPKDGTKFDVWIPDAFGGRRMCDLSFNQGGRLRQHGLLRPADLPRWPTHWRPVPDGPKGQDGPDSGPGMNPKAAFPQPEQLHGEEQ